MNLDYIAHRLKEIGWKPATQLVYAGESFDLQFSRRIRFEPWVVNSRPLKSGRQRPIPRYNRLLTVVCSTSSNPISTSSAIYDLGHGFCS